MKARNANVFETATNALVASNESELNNSNFGNDEISDADLIAINGGSPLGSGLGQVGEGLATILNPVIGGLLGLVS